MNVFVLRLWTNDKLAGPFCQSLALRSLTWADHKHHNMSKLAWRSPELRFAMIPVLSSRRTRGPD
jgi:hypothetical protein